jgi:hypothetical protein
VSDYYRSSRRGGVGAGCAIALVVGVAALVLCIAVAPYYSTQIWWVLREGLFWMVPVVVVAGLVLAAAASFDNRNSGVGAGLSMLAVAGSIATILFWISHEYQQDAYYASTIKVTTDPVPALAQRTPFNVSQAQVRSNLGDVPGKVQQTTYLPDSKEFTTPVERLGTFSGYQTLLVQNITDTSRNTALQCNFSSQADARIGGLFSHSLERAINSQQRWVNWDSEDAYGYCDHGVPMIVAPLKEQDGWLVVTERPAGIALYNGATGQVDIRPNAIGIPGPSYPLSLAATQREASVALSGFSDWWWNRAGWELPDDTDEINSGNTAEFVLADTDHNHSAYATLLTGRGSATAISAIAVTDARLEEGRGDQLAPITVHHTNPGWSSPAAILDRIHADFGDVFATQRTAQIFELAPRGGNEWTATIGLPQNLLYRVRGMGDLSTSPCLFALDGQQIRCGPVVNANGAGPGVAIGSLPSAPGAAVPHAAPDADLGKLSNQQLTDLIDRANREAARRLPAGP